MMFQEKLEQPSLTALRFANLGINTVAASQAVMHFAQSLHNILRAHLQIVSMFRHEGSGDR
jgi:hypothetical protein